MATVINPDNGEFIIKGALSADGITSADGDLELGKVRIDSVDDIDLSNIPANYAVSDVALNVAGGTYVAGNSYVGGTFVANGDVVTLGNASGSLTLSANINSDIIPSATSTYNVGSNSLAWAGVFTDKLYLSNVTEVTSTTGAAQFIDDGTTDGEIKIIVAVEAPSSVITFTPTTPIGFNTISVSNSGDSATLIWKTGYGWAVLNAFRATVS